MVTVPRNTPAVARLLRRLPRWLVVLIGVTGVVFGAVLILRPFVSLRALVVMLSVGFIVHGVSEVLRHDGRWVPIALGSAWAVLGAVVLLVPGVTITVLTIAVGIGLIVEGVVGCARAITGEQRDRAAGLMFALATIILGVVALAWPDVTVIAIALIFGIRMVIFGSQEIFHPGRQSVAGTRPTGSRVRRTVVAAVTLMATAALAGLSSQLSGTPQPDDFYAAPENPPDEPGQLIRAEPFDRAIPPGATAWRILYSTTVDDDRPAVASAIVVTPDSAGEHPVIGWAHGTTGFATGCAPSLLEDPFKAGAMPDLAGTLAQGWAVVATDYVGLGTAGAHPYLIGQGEGRSVLDSLRAAQQLADAQLAEDTVIWGHSQGGHAALWAGALARSYAPELDIAGVAAVAPAANLPALFDALNDTAIGSLFGSFALAAYVAEYPDVQTRDYVRPGVRLMVDAMQQRCLTDPGTLVSVATAVVGNDPIWSRDPVSGVLGERARENVPTLPVAAPLLIAQGDSDTLVLPGAQDTYLQQRCAAGQQVDYRVYPGEDHLSIVDDASPLIGQLREWTEMRLRGEQTIDSCRR